MKIVFHMNVTHCSKCPNGKVLPDPDPDDWFNADDVKVVCTKENKEVAGALRPHEVGKCDEVPNWCPFK